MASSDDALREAVEDGAGQTDSDSPAGEVPRQAFPKRAVTTAPPPITPLRGSGWVRHTTPSQVPPALPDSLPGFLAPKADSIICEAVKEFPDQTQCAQLCRRVMSELTPHFSAAVRDKLVRANLVRLIVSDLLRTLVVYNSNYDLFGSSLQQEFWRSDEWRTLASEVVQASEETAAADSAAKPKVSLSGQGQSDEHTLDAISYLVEPTLRQFNRDLEDKYEKLKDEAPPTPAYAKPLWVAKLRAELAKEHLSGLFRICGEALEKAGNPRTPFILRTILSRFLLPAVAGHVQSVEGILQLPLFRSHYITAEALAVCQVTIEGYVQDVSRLGGIWTDKIEIEARALEFSKEASAQTNNSDASSVRREGPQADLHGWMDGRTAPVSSNFPDDSVRREALDAERKDFSEPIADLRTAESDVLRAMPAAETKGEFAEDELPLRVQRGEFSERVIKEVKQLNKELRKVRYQLTFEELHKLYPQFESLSILSRPPFDDADRELICRPRQWGVRSPRYATGILKRHFRVGSDETVRGYRKVYRKAQKTATP